MGRSANPRMRLAAARQANRNIRGLLTAAGQDVYAPVHRGVNLRKRRQQRDSRLRVNLLQSLDGPEGDGRISLFTLFSSAEAPRLRAS